MSPVPICTPLWIKGDRAQSLCSREKVGCESDRQFLFNNTRLFQVFYFDKEQYVNINAGKRAFKLGNSLSLKVIWVYDGKVFWQFCTSTNIYVEACVAEQLTPQTLDLEVRGSSLACGIVSLDKELNSTLSPFTQVYLKWVLATYCWGGRVTLWWTSIPSRGGGAGGGRVAILLSMLFYATETGIRSGCLGFWLMCTFSFTLQTYMAIPKNLFIVFCLADLYGCCVADPRGYNAVLLLWFAKSDE